MAWGVVMKIGPQIALACLALAYGASAGARVVATTPQGFEVSATTTIAASPAEVYAALVQINRWWNGEHSYSGDAANMSLDPRAGGCFCERLADGGSIEHMRVVYAQPGKALRLRGALGPLQAEGVDGALTWTLAPHGAGTIVTQHYVVGGYVRNGIDKFAPIVNQVLGEQLGRLKGLIETGAVPTPKTR